MFNIKSDIEASLNAKTFNLNDFVKDRIKWC